MSELTNGRASHRWYNCFLFISLVLLIAFSCIIPSVQATPQVFKDLTIGEPSYPFVNYLVKRNLLSGYPDGCFHPDGTITRAEITALLVKSQNISGFRPVASTFNDVGTEHWAYPFIEAAVHNGLIKGYPDGSFRPDNPVTRAEISVLILGLTREPLPPITPSKLIQDLNPDYWASKQISAALDAGLLTIADSNRCAPDAPVTRAQAARALAIFLNISPELIEVPLTGKLVPIRGSIIIKEIDKEPYQVTSNTDCGIGVRITTESDSNAELRFDDGSGLKIEANTELTIKSARGQSTILRDGSPGTVVDFLELDMPRGKIYGALASGYIYDIDQQAADEQAINAYWPKPGTGSGEHLLALTGTFPLDLYGATGKSISSEKETLPWWKAPYSKRVRVQIDMPWGIAGIRGTFWMSEVASRQQITNVLDGTAEVTAAGRTVSVDAGHKTVITSETTSSIVSTVMTQAEKEDWKNAGIWVEERATAIQAHAPVVTPPVPIEKQLVPGTTGLLPEIIVPPAPPVIDEVMKSLAETTGTKNAPEISGGNAGLQIDTNPPSVSKTDPVFFAKGVPLAQTIRVTFNEQVQAGRNFSNISLKAGDTAVAITCSLSEKVLSINPGGNLHPSTDYILIIPTGSVKDNFGNELTYDYQLAFNTVRSWQFDTIDNTGYVGRHPSMVLDDSGMPHISYYDEINQDLKYAYQDTEGWHYETADRTGYVGRYSALTLDDSGCPHITYISESNQDSQQVKYAYKDADGWHIDIVDTVGSCSSAPSIAIDPWGTVLISYYNRTRNSLVLAYKDSSDWQKEFLDGSQTWKGLTGISLAVDKSGTPCISYCDASNGELKYFLPNCLPDVVDINTGVDETNMLFCETSLALGPTNLPRIAYFDVNHGLLKYVYRDLRGFNYETIDQSGESGSSQLVLDDAGFSHIAYVVSTSNAGNYTSAVKYGYRDETGWKTETVADKIGSWGGDCSLAIDTSGNKHICYYDAAMKALRYACWNVEADINPPVVLKSNPAENSGLVNTDRTLILTFNETVRPGGQFTGIKILAGVNEVSADKTVTDRILSIDPCGELEPDTLYTLNLPAGSVEDSSGNELVNDYSFNFCTGKSWDIGTVDFAMPLPKNPLALDNSGNPHISYLSQSGNLNYAYHDVLGWHTETVAENCAPNDITVDASGNPHIVYIADDLIYVHRDGLAWRSEIIAPVGSEGKFAFNQASQALDSYGYAHIAYAYYGSSDSGLLKYTYQDACGWHTETVADLVGGGYHPYPSIVVDALNRPHISFNSANEGNLYYAYKNESVWNTGLVDSNSHSGVSYLALDSNGNPYIGYQCLNTPYTDLRFAHREMSGWKTETVTRAIGLHLYAVSLALDSQSGKTYLSYYDFINKDLKYYFKDTAGWQSETIDSLGAVGTGASMMIDAGGHPHFCYYDRNNNCIKYAHPAVVNSSPPTVMQCIPVNGARGILVNSSLTLTFNEKVWVDRDFGSISVRSEATPVNATITLTGNTLTLDPVCDLVPATTYTVIIPAGSLKNIAGNNLAGDYTFSFTTAGAWQHQTLDSACRVCDSCAIDLDSLGNPHISYYDYTNHCIKYTFLNTSGWQTEIVSSDWVYDPSIVVDNIGNPHISYVGGWASDIRYAYHDGSKWNFQTVDSVGSTGMCNVVIGLDTDGNPQICYGDDVSKTIKYAWLDTSGWHSEIVETMASTCPYLDKISLATDIEGKPHIAYQNPIDYSEGKIRYAYRDASGWNVENVVDVAYGGTPSIVIDKSNQIYISYQNDGSLYCAHRTDNGWNFETVDSNVDLVNYTTQYKGYDNRMAVDDFGNLHISYCNHLNYDTEHELKCAHRDASGWHIETIENSGTYYKSAIAVDDSDSLHIVYFESNDSPNGQLRYAWIDAKPPQVSRSFPADGEFGVAIGQTLTVNFNESVKPGANFGYIALQAGNIPVEMVCDINGNQLRLDPLNDLSPYSIYTVIIPMGAVTDNAGNQLATEDSITFTTGRNWQIETVDSAGMVGQDTSIALDFSGNPHVSYRDVVNEDLKYAYQDESGWHIETIDSEGNTGYSTSIAVDQSDNIHISYHDYSNHQLKYALKNKGSSTWQIEIVDNNGNVGLDTSITVDLSGNPQISYRDYSNKCLMYAHKNASIWQIEKVDETGDTGGHTSITLDSLARPHISYYDVANGDLKYTHKNDDGWQYETVDSEGDVGYYSSLILSPSGNPMISYYDGSNKDLKYARKDYSGWHIETVDSTGDVGLFTSICMDASGNPFISYYDDSNYALKIAHQDESGWQSETVDSAGVVGSYTSMAVDAFSRLHISYYDGSNYHFKYAHWDTDMETP